MQETMQETADDQGYIGIVLFDAPFLSLQEATARLTSLISTTPYKSLVSRHTTHQVVEVTFAADADVQMLENIVRNSLGSPGMSFSLLPPSPFLRHKRLAIFDMDSTLIQQECIDEMARLVGVVNEVSVRYSFILNEDILN
jgi:hypothetical protein